jgi:hypothetical protein
MHRFARAAILGRVPGSNNARTVDKDERAPKPSADRQHDDSA